MAKFGGSGSSTNDFSGSSNTTYKHCEGFKVATAFPRFMRQQMKQVRLHVFIDSLLIHVQHLHSFVKSDVVIITAVVHGLHILDTTGSVAREKYFLVICFNCHHQ